MILVSALGPNSSIFLFWITFIPLGDLFGHGLRPGLGPGLDNLFDWRAGRHTVLRFIIFGEKL